MITKPDVRILPYPAENTIRVCWDYILRGKRSPIKTCRIRLGRGETKQKITWTKSLDCRGNYQNGHVEEYLEEKDIPQDNKDGTTVYVQFLIQPEFVINDETGEIEENHEGRIVLSEVIQLTSAILATKFKKLRQNATAQRQVRPDLQM